MSDVPQTAKHMIDAALAGGRAAMTIYCGDFVVTEKADSSPVCEADRAAESVILKELERHFPGVPVAAEESCAAGHRPDCGQRFFLVDPLDGTKEFISRNGEFTVNIALIEDGIPVAGTVLAPALQTIWFAANGKAYSGETDPDLLSVKHWQRVKTRKSSAPPVAVASRSHQTPRTQDLLDDLGVQECRQIGSSLKFCLLADAEADLYPRLGPTMEWDTAAGDAVLRAAGGLVVTLDGAPLAYGAEKSSVPKCFANPDFVAIGDRALLAAVLDIEPK